METRFQIRAIPVGLAFQLSRRLLALGPSRVSTRSILEHVTDWWAGDAIAGAAGAQPEAAAFWDDRSHPLDYAIRQLELEAGRC